MANQEYLSEIESLEIDFICLEMELIAADVAQLDKQEQAARAEFAERIRK